MRRIIKTILVLPLLAIVLALMLGLFFGTPLFAIAETVDIVRARSTAVATVTKVEVIFGTEGSRPQVEYAYNVAGAKYAGHRYAPGWFANAGSWTGGGSDIRRRYWPGQVITIHYQPDNPAHSCLEYGWFKWSIGFSMGFWGSLWGSLLSRQNRKNNILRGAMAMAMVFGGFGLIFFGPDVIQVDKAIQFLAYFLGIFAACSLYLLLRQRRGAESFIAPTAE